MSTCLPLTWNHVPIAAVFACCAVGCSSEDMPVPEGYSYSPVQWVISWTSQPDRIVFWHEERWKRSDAAVAYCYRSGLYEITGGASPTRVRIEWDKEVCELDLRQETTSGKPDGSELILAERGKVLRLEFRGGTLIPVAIEGIGSAHYPAWSPGGEHIALVGHPLNSTGAIRDLESLYLVSADGSDLRQVTTFNQRRVRSFPSWSPDGQLIALSVAPEAGGPFTHPGEVVVVDTRDGSQLVVASGYDPSWSPGGDWIAYLSITVARSAAGGNYFEEGAGRDQAPLPVPALRLVRRDGTDDHVLFHSGGHLELGTAPQTRRGPPWGRAVWSPDGTHLAFSRWFENGSTIWVARVADGHLTQKTWPHLGDRD